MRPMLKASTALLASLSLLTPSVLTAQTPVIEDQSGTEMAAPPEQAPAETPSEPPAAEAEPATDAAPTAEAPEPQPEPAPAEPVVDTAAEPEPSPVEAPTPPEATADTSTPQEAAPVAQEQQASPAPIDEVAPAAPSDPETSEPQQDSEAAPVPQTPELATEPATEDAQPATTVDDEAEALKKALEDAAEAQPDTSAEQPLEESPATDQEPASPAQDTPEAAVTDTPPEQAATPSPPAVDLSDAPAPEAAAVETDLSREAATPSAPVESAALQAVLERGESDDPAATIDDAPAGEVSDFTVTQENIRSSAEDFLTSTIADVTGAEPAAAQPKEKDNKSRDIARLALAGMAGLAVGHMMSNNRQVALNTGDRLVVTLPDGSQQLIKDEDTLLFQPGSNVKTERYDDGSSITTVLRDDGSRVLTIRDANMRILRRSVQWPDGRTTMLIDDTGTAAPVVVSDLPPAARPVEYSATQSESALRDALMREASIGRQFSLGQIRDIAQVRALVAPLDIQSITFDTGSAAITPDQASQLSTLGRVITESVRQNPGEMFMIEGYTDAIGSDASNLALSDRRAESVALALTEYFKVPPENMIVQGYGEQFLRIQTQEAERANRRVAVRRITDLLARN